MPVLEHFLKNWQEGGALPLSVEVRHESWFENTDTLGDFMELLSRYNVAAVITDVAGRRDVCHMGVTTDKVLIRFVGNGLHPTDFTRIDEWVERLKGWFEKGLSEAYFFTHEPDNVLAPEMAVYLASKMAEIPGVTTRGPKIIEAKGGQISLF